MKSRCESLTFDPSDGGEKVPPGNMMGVFRSRKRPALAGVLLESNSPTSTIVAACVPVVRTDLRRAQGILGQCV